jgi:DNA-binding transcriptional ArsR family regulator
MTYLPDIESAASSADEELLPASTESSSKFKVQSSRSKGQNDPLAAIVEWDCGTAYDLLLSAHTILNPRSHGIAAPWAAGVRKRLGPQSQRDFKAFYNASHSYRAYTPLHLVHEMDPPKDARRFLDYVEAIPDEDFSRRMHFPYIGDETLERVTARALKGEKIKESELEAYRKGITRIIGVAPAPAAEVRRLFAEMADPAGTKKRWLTVMREYYSAFFAEEEQREKSVLERMVDEAREMAAASTVSDTVERVSHGFTISEDIDLRRLVLVPSIWFHPFTVRMQLAERELLVVWGAHPPGYKLVPGESVPDEALLVLRALGDATRLRLLRLIAAEPRSLQSLAQEVKLSLPTVSHHIRELRGAGLIRLELAGTGRESKYTVRWSSAQQAFRELEEFVKPGMKRDV